MGARMEEKINFSVVGFFVLVLGTAMISGVLWFSSGKYYHKDYDFYLTYLEESVSGLKPDAPVSYRGVEIGHVHKIALAPGNIEQVQLTLAVERGTPVKVDTLAVLQTQGLTGISSIELNGGSLNSPPLQKKVGEKYPVIKAAPSRIKRLDTALSGLIVNINRVSENFNILMGEGNQQAIRRTLADVEVLSHTLAARAAAIDSSLVNAARTMENTSRITKELPQLVQRTQRSVENFDRMTNELARTGIRARSAIDGTRQFTSETLPELHQLVLELRDLTRSLQRVSNDLEQNPSALLLGKPKAKRGPGE